MAGSRKHRTRLVHSAPKKLDEVRSEINVTPLVDVCLVLLIIFMVVLPMLTRGKEVRLPLTQHHTSKKDVGEQPIVSVVRDGSNAKVYFDRDLVNDMDQLKLRTTEALKRLPQGMPKVIFLKADKELPFEKVYPVLIALHDAGSENVELGTNEAKE